MNNTLVLWKIYNQKYNCFYYYLTIIIFIYLSKKRNKYLLNITNFILVIDANGSAAQYMDK